MSQKNIFLFFSGILILTGVSLIKIVNLQDYNPTVIVQTNEFSNSKSKELLKDHSVITTFKSNNNNLGIISIAFDTHNQINNDYLEFKIRETNSDQWYYINKYKVDQFQNSKYFPFGFPEIKDSYGKEYQIEIKSLSGETGNSFIMITNKTFLSKYSFPKTYLLQNKKYIPVFIYKKISSYIHHITNIEYLYMIGVVIFLNYLQKNIGIISLIKKNKNTNFQQTPTTKTSSARVIVPYLVAGTTSLMVFYIKNTNILKVIKSISSNTNIITFTISILVFCSVFLVTYLIFYKIRIENIVNHKILPKNILFYIKIIIFTVFVVLTWLTIIGSSNLLGYTVLTTTSNKHLPLIVVGTNCLLFFIFRKYLLLNNFIYSGKFWFIIAIITATVTSYFFYTPNGLLYNYNHSAYYNSIYIHEQGIPYSEKFTSAYGHYAIFYKPILKLIGTNIHTVSAVTAIVAFIFVLSIIFCVYVFVKNPFIRFLGLISIIFPFAGLLPFPYPQTFPHRFLFPSIIMALSTYIIKNNKRKIFINIGYLICLLSIIWNTDTGLVCLLAWTILHTYLLFFFKEKNTKNIFLNISTPLALAITTFIGSWGFINIYNILIGGDFINLYYFLFPLLEHSYMYDILHTEIPLYLNYWIPVLLLFYFFVGLGIVSVFTRKYNKKITFMFFTSILGIGQMTYFINRCAYLNIFLCYYQVLLLILIITQLSFSRFSINKKNKSGVVNEIILYCGIFTLLIFVSILIVNIKYKVISSIKYFNTSELNSITDYIRNNVPEDTPIISVNTSILGISLGWKNELGFTDLPNLFTINSRERLMRALITYNKPFLIDKGYYRYFGGVEGVFYIPLCDEFKKITNTYNIREFNEMSRYENIQDDSILLYLTPKK